MAKVLIIDDNHYIRFTLTEVLEEYGYETLTAESCEDGLLQAVSETPCLIILDKKLPDGDGIDLLKKLKSNQEQSSIPVIMLTAYANEISADEAMKLGAYAFFTKPFDNDEIVSVIQKAISPAQ